MPIPAPCGITEAGTPGDDREHICNPELSVAAVRSIHGHRCGIGSVIWNQRSKPAAPDGRPAADGGLSGAAVVCSTAGVDRRRRHESGCRHTVYTARRLRSYTCQLAGRCGPRTACPGTTGSSWCGACGRAHERGDHQVRIVVRLAVARAEEGCRPVLCRSITLRWAVTGSNRRPSRCKRDALPAELTALGRQYYPRPRQHRRALRGGAETRSSSAISLPILVMKCLRPRHS